jgi:hypothetical protein
MQMAAKAEVEISRQQKYIYAISKASLWYLVSKFTKLGLQVNMHGSLNAESCENWPFSLRITLIALNNLMWYSSMISIAGVELHNELHTKEKWVSLMLIRSMQN